LQQVFKTEKTVFFLNLENAQNFATLPWVFVYTERLAVSTTKTDHTICPSCRPSNGSIRELEKTTFEERRAAVEHASVSTGHVTDVGGSAIDRCDGHATRCGRHRHLFLQNRCTPTNQRPSRLWKLP